MAPQTLPDWEPASASEILRAAYARFGRRLTIGTGLGPSGIALLHMVREIEPAPDVFFLDTGLHFDDTLALREQVERRLSIQIRPLRPTLSVTEQAAWHGPALWEREPDRCCAMRKVAPLREHLAGYDAWVTAIRRDQGASRAAIPVIRHVRAYGVVKIAPLAGWDRARLWRYLHDHDLPYNPLHDRGYPSVGCAPCTRPVAVGGAERAGRWAGQSKVECGLHTV